MEDDPDTIREPNDISGIEHKPVRWLWLIATVAVLLALFFIFRDVYLNSAASERWPNIGAAATAAATIIAGAGLFFLAAQARDSASAARLAVKQAQTGAETLRLAQQEFIAHLTSARRQQALMIFESITLGQTLEARGRLAESLKSMRPESSRSLKLRDLESTARDDLFQIMRRFQQAAAMCLPLEEGTDAYVDRKMASRLIGWDIAWWYGALTGAFGESLTKSGLAQSWESLDRLNDWIEKQDGSLAEVREIAERWVKSPLSTS